MLQSDQESPSVSGRDQGFHLNTDSSLDVYSNPKALEGFE
jgi:hypothetical protein